MAITAALPDLPTNIAKLLWRKHAYRLHRWKSIWWNGSKAYELQSFLWTDNCLQARGYSSEAACTEAWGIQRVHNTINREIRRQLKRGRHIHFEEPANNNTDKDVILSSIFSYCETNKHVLYTCNDVKDHLQRSTRIRKLPSTTTIARYLKNNIGLSFKKVNIRSTSLWSNLDVITKLKYSWIYHNLCSRGYMITYIDEFNISDTSIKKYSWTRRGSQNYWFGPRR